MTTHTLPAQDGATRSGARAALPFVALAFTLSWGLWAVALALGGDVADPAVFALYAIGACGPSLATGILRLLGRSGGQRTRWAAVPAWLPVAVLLGAVPAVLAAVVPGLLGGAPFDLAVLGAAVAGVGGLLPFMAVQLVAGPLAEEFGWRGYLQPVLRRRFGPAGTAAVVGGVWAAWHVPLFLLAGTVQSQMGLFTLTALGFFMAMLPMSVGYWFVTERLRGGVPAAVLVHLTGNIALTFLFAAPSVVGGVTYLATLVVIAAVLLATAGPRRS
jgi:membrane protease YdiL (CAAX protease family)